MVIEDTQTASDISDSLLRYGFVKPHVRKHKNGPFLVCSNGMTHWLSVFDRFKLFFHLTSVYKLDKKYANKHCSLPTSY